MKKSYLLPLFLLLTLNSFGQQKAINRTTTETTEAPAFQRCATVERTQALRAANPSFPSDEDFERYIQRAMASRNATLAARSQAEQVLYLPVVVHIIHQGEETGQGSNIAYEQVLSQIEVLNEDFRRKAETRGFNDHVAGADVNVEFVLAAVDPTGNPLPEQGIHRVQDATLGISGPISPEDMDGIVKPATFWDPARYFNIWTADLGEGLLGYAQFPTDSGLEGVDYSGMNAAAETDGVVVLYNAFGSSDKGNFPLLTPYDKGRTATHEVGHWLGLRHIWGDGGCDVDDYCSDTPISDGPNFGCPLEATSCNSVDMIENYMDYTDDACMNIFTVDQKARMLTVLGNSPRRKELLSSDVLPVRELTANFTADKLEIKEGEQIVFTDASQGSISSWSWVFEGGTPATSAEQNPVVIYGQAGSYRVSLTVSNAQNNTDEMIMEQYILVRESDWVNSAPVLAGEIEHPLLQVAEAKSLALGALFYDADGHALSYSVANENGEVLEAVLTESTLSLEGLRGGSSDLTIVAQDHMGGQVQVVLQVRVNARPEVISTPEDQLLQVSEERSFSLGDYFVDPDGGQLSYTFSAENVSVADGAIAGEQFTLTGLSSGYTTVKAVADDGLGGRVELVFGVEVNQQPMVMQVPADQWLVLGQDTSRLRLSEVFEDFEGGQLSFQLKLSAEGYLSYEFIQDELTFVAKQPGSTNVTLQATDDKLGVSSVSFIVGGHSLPYERQVLPGQEVSLGDTLRIDLAGYFADKDGHSLSYEVANSTEGLATAVSGSMLELAGLVMGEESVIIKVVDEKDGLYEKHLTVMVVEPLSVDRMFRYASIKAYPNPVTANTWLKIEGGSPGRYQLELFDLQGRKMKAEEWEQVEENDLKLLYMNGLPRGTYLLKVHGEEVVYMQRIVKK